MVIGLGNLLASDDAVGIEVARALLRGGCWPPIGSPEVRVVEGATAGLGLIDLLLDLDLAILVDAISSGAPPGTVIRLEEDQLPRANLRPLSAHDLALPEALQLGRLLYPDRMPRKTVVFGVEAGQLAPYRQGLTAAVRAAVPEVVKAILSELEAERTS